MRFRAVAHWDLRPPTPPPRLHLQPTWVGGRKRVASRPDFDDRRLAPPTPWWVDEARPGPWQQGLQGVPSPWPRWRPAPTAAPQAAVHDLHPPAGGRPQAPHLRQQVMSVAQGLYERGYITYMRTDSTSLSETAARRRPGPDRRALFGGPHPPKPRTYARKVKNAQEAHEAVRPAGEAFAPRRAEGRAQPTELRLYDPDLMRPWPARWRDARVSSR